MSEAQNSNEQQGQFALQRIYVKDLSFEVPNAPKVFLNNWQPDVNVQLSTQSQRIDEQNNYEVVLGLTVTVTNAGATAFLVEIQQAGIFMINGVPEQQLAHLLGSYCPNTLFPYAREAISDVVSRGSFPQLLLAPVNFDAVLAETLRQRQQQASAEAPASVQ